MAWAKLDDKFHGNPKVLQASLPALGLYALGLSYCCDQLTDGQLSRKVVAGWKGWKPAADDLVRVGLWEETPGGYVVHDYLQWNASRQQIVHERADAADRKRTFRERRTNAGRNGDATWDSGPPTPTPTPTPLPDVTKVTSPGLPQNPAASGRAESGAQPPKPRSRASPRTNGTNPRATGANPRADGSNPRAVGTNPRRRRQSGFEFDEDGPRYEQRTGADGKREWVQVEA